MNVNLEFLENLYFIPRLVIENTLNLHIKVLHEPWILLNKNSDFKCSEQSSSILVLKTVSVHARHVLYMRTLLRTLQAGINNTNLLVKSLSRLLRKCLVFFMRVSTVFKFASLFIQVESLIGRIERLGRRPLHSNVGVALDRWLACIKELQGLRKNEINHSPGTPVGSYGCRSFNDQGMTYSSPLVTYCRQFC